MYTVRITHVPALGKGPALRAALEQHSKASNEAGGSYSVSQLLYTKEPAFLNSIRYDTLAALDAYQAALPNDTARQARLAKVNECLALPQTSELYEVLVPSQPTGPVNCSLRIKYFAASGKNQELREALERRLSMPRKGAVGAGLSSQVASNEGFNYVVSILFSNFAALEEFRQGDPSVQAFQAQTASLLARPVTQQLSRILLPFPAP